MSNSNNSDNNISDGPIPFFASDDNQSNFLSGTNITDNTTSKNQSTQPVTQVSQQTNTAATTTTNTTKSIQDVSSLFGNNKEDSFLSNLTSNTGTTNNNASTPASTLPNTNNLYYSQVNNGSTSSLTHQPYSTPYISNSDSNPQSIHSSSSYTNLSSFNQTSGIYNNTTNASGYANTGNTIPNKSPYIPSPEPNSTTYKAAGTSNSTYAQSFYTNPATQGSQTSLSNYTSNYAATGSSTSLNSFATPHKTQTFPPPNYSNMYGQESSNTINPPTKNYSTYQPNYYNNTNTYVSPTSTSNSNTTPSTTTATSTTPYNAATTNTTSSYSNPQTTGTGFSNYNSSTTGQTNTVPPTSSYVTSQGNTTSNTSQPSSSVSGAGYSMSQNTTNTGYSTSQPSATNTYSTTNTGYQTNTTNSTTAVGTGYPQTTSSTYNTYPQTTSSTTKTGNNVLNPSASYSSLNTLGSTYNTTTTTTNLNNGAATSTTAASGATVGTSTNPTAFTNFTNNSSSQVNYYTNTTATASTSPLTNMPETSTQAAPSIRSNTPGASSLNDLTLESNPAGMNPYANASPNSGSANASYINSSTSLNETVPATSNTADTNGANSAVPSLYYQNKNSQSFYANAATSSSSPCLNSMNTAYSTATTATTAPRKNSYNDGTSGKHIKSNSVMSPSSNYQTSLYAKNNESNADNASFTGSVNSRNDQPISSLYYHEDNNGKFRSPTAPPSSDNVSKMSPSTTNANLSRPPSVPPNYGSYNYGKTTTATTNNTTTTTTWKPTATPNMSYASYTGAPSTSTYATTTPYSTSTTPNPYQPSTTPNPYQTETTGTTPYQPSTTPNPYQPSTTPNPYQPSTTPNPYQPSTTPNPYQPSTTPNPYQPSTTPNPYSTDTTQYYGSGTVDPSGNQNFYTMDNQSQGEIHSCDPIVMHQNLSPVVSFGFGGKLVVMFPKDLSGTSYGSNTVGPNTVHVKPMANLLYPNVIEDCKEHEGPLLGQKKNKKQVLEMLTKKINKAKSKDAHYNSYSSLNASDSDEVLLLKVIQLYIENDGVLYGQNSKPEAVQSLRNLLLNNDPTPVSTTHTMINGPSVNSTEIENIKNCLLQGDRPGACKIAVNHKLWAHALIISSYINKETYKDVVNSFIKSELQGENESQRSSFQSIKVLYSLFAGMGKDAIIDTSSSSSLPMTNPLSTQPLSSAMPATTLLPPTTSSTAPTSIHATSDIVAKWKEILGMILSNRTPNDTTAIVSLGDTLLSAGKLFPAHLCYLLSPSSISGLGNKNTKAVLLGTNHYQNRRFYQDLNAFEITEYLEYMYYLSNKNLSTLPHFQAYKLIFAHWLSDLGFVTPAFNYTQCMMQIMKSGTSSSNNGTTNASQFYNQTFFENLKEFSSRCQGHLSGTKNAPKDGWFSKITKFDTFLEAFDHGLNKFIGSTETEKVPTPANASASQPPAAVNPVAMMPPTAYNATTTPVLKNSASYQSLNQPYFKNSYSTENLHSAQGSRKNSFSKENQKGVFSLIGNLFNKNSNAPTTNNSSTNSLNQEEVNHSNGYYDSITKQWVTTNSQTNDKFGNDITVPPPAASDFYGQGYNTSNTPGMNAMTNTGTLSNGVIPQFNAMGTTSNTLSNTRRNNRTKYNDPTLSMAYTNTSGQATQNSTIAPPPLYSTTNNSTTVDNQNNTSYTGYNYYGN